jgi:hypothetical protein
MFLRVGQQIINLDLVTDVKFRGSDVEVWLAAPARAGSARSLTFEGAEATKLTEWFELHARDASTSPTAFSLLYLK